MNEWKNDKNACACPVFYSFFLSLRGLSEVCMKQFNVIEIPTVQALWLRANLRRLHGIGRNASCTVGDLA